MPLNITPTGSTFIHSAHACASGRIWPTRAPQFFLTSQPHLVRQLRYDDGEKTTLPRPRRPLYSLETVLFAYVCVTYLGGMRSIKNHPSFLPSFDSCFPFLPVFRYDQSRRQNSGKCFGIPLSRADTRGTRSDGQGSSRYSLTEPLLAL